MIATLALSVVLAQSQMQMDHGAMQHNAPAVIRAGLGNLHHKVNTKNKLAQDFFDQGIELSYGFNHHASIASFEEAIKLDPNLAMAHWGKAYAMGMNINMPIDAPTNKEAFAEVQKAVALKGKATQEERDLIDALAQRYSNDDNPDFDKLNNAYAKAMAALAMKYPDDVDVQTWYAESLMDLRPWKLWTADGKPAPDTETIVKVLQNAIRLNPNHIGANHFLIHAVEASPHPEVALEAARRLDRLAPQSGHLVHMPSHIYLRMGIWDKGLQANEAALKVDEAFLAKTPDPGIYPMYYIHNFDMFRACADMAGNYEKAKWAADNVAEKSAPMGPMGDPMLSEPWLEMARFGRWKDILALKPPTGASPFVEAQFHYVHGMASASTNKVIEGEKDFDRVNELRAKVPADYLWLFTPGTLIIDVETNLLAARLMKARSSRSRVGESRLFVQVYRLSRSGNSIRHMALRQSLKASASE